MERPNLRVRLYDPHIKTVSAFIESNWKLVRSRISARISLFSQGIGLPSPWSRAEYGGNHPAQIPWVAQIRSTANPSWQADHQPHPPKKDSTHRCFFLWIFLDKHATVFFKMEPFYAEA